MPPLRARRGRTFSLVDGDIDAVNMEHASECEAAKAGPDDGDCRTHLDILA